MVQKRALLVAAASAALVAVVVADMGTARAGSPPQVEAVIEGVDSASGRGTVLVAGKKVGKFRTFSVRNLDGELIGDADLLYKTKDLVALALPRELPAGDYRLSLEPKRGAATLTDFSYLASRFSFPPGRNVGIGTTSPLATLDVQGTLLVQGESQFLSEIVTQDDVDVGMDLLVGGDAAVTGNVEVTGDVVANGAVRQDNAFGTSLLDAALDQETGLTNVATFLSKLGAASRLRLERDPNGDGFELGQSLAGDFVIDDLDGNRLMELSPDRRMLLGVAGDAAQLFVNTTPLTNVTCGLTQRSGDALTFGIFETDGDPVLQVAGRDMTLSQGNLAIAQGSVQVTTGNVGISAGDLGVTVGNVVVGAGDVGINEGALVVGAGDITLNQGDLVVAQGDGFKQGGGSWAVLSDRRLKKDIAPLRGALGTLLALRGVTYEYRDPDAIGERAGRHTGFVAQDVEEVLPEWVGTRDDGIKYVAPKGFESLTATAFAELKAEKDAEVAGLRDENAALRARLAELEARDAEREARLRRLEEALLGAGANGATETR